MTYDFSVFIRMGKEIPTKTRLKIGQTLVSFKKNEILTVKMKQKYDLGFKSFNYQVKLTSNQINFFQI